MAKRRTSGIQRRGRATEAAMSRRIDPRRGSAPIDTRLLFVGGVLVLGAIVLVIVLLFGGGGSADRVGIQNVNEGANHVGQEELPTYRNVPATSGPHWNLGDGAAPLFWRVYSSPVPEAAVIHNLEHGGIVIWYQATASDADVDVLTQFVQQQLQTSNFKYILSPWAGADFDHPIAVTAWDWVLYLDTADTDAIRAFREDHPVNDAPEPAGGPAQGAG
ncbi:MAG TPA: DUF3105 domain-containing protein [Candidatus Limnocylindria bacterium]|nr:DUF3105 domain-containing protein [Candidatus Limnocylindria bacterium]